MRPVFSYAEQKASLLRFAERVPELLLRHPSTAALAARLSQLGLADALESRFTVAIIGQMRVGKSTLLNALIGRPLAPTGVTETTATINWFRYGAGELCDKFRVHWVDGSSEDLPLGRVEGWIGQAENAHRTRALDFFASSEFLKTCNIVDTPGTRSTLESHESATRGFLAEKLESETLKHGGRADAVIYALNPVARQDDSDLLRFFGERTRLPGASAYNSIAVVQKWEHLRPDPFEEVGRMCERLRRQLEGTVAEVLPVSGLLAMSCLQYPASVWDRIAQLVAGTPEDILDDLMTAPAYFRDEAPAAAISEDERAELASAVSWPVLSFAVWMCRARAIASGGSLRNVLWDVAGIDRLHGLLQDRFFSLAGLIQAGSVLRKAWDPCATALLSLREVREARLGLRKLANASRETLVKAMARQGELKPVLTYVTDSLQSVQAEIQLVEGVLEELDAIVRQAERDFDLLQRDVECLRQLDGLESEIGPDDMRSLRRLFGQDGPDIGDRLALPATFTANQALLVTSEAYEHWSRQQRRARGALRRLCEHAAERLAMMMDRLEGEESAL